MNPREAILNLLKDNGLPSIGPERRAGVKSADEIDRAVDPAHPQCDLIRALVLLWHDHLHASHSLSQNIHTPDGSYVHGIMHRREPDYFNSKYWFRSVGDHPVFAAMKSHEPKWDPFAFVDACESASPDDLLRLRETQAREITLLLQRALG